MSYFCEQIVNFHFINPTRNGNQTSSRLCPPGPTITVLMESYFLIKNKRIVMELNGGAHILHTPTTGH